MFSSPTPAESQSAPAPEKNTGIEGVISVSPAHGGPARVGVPNSRPLANVEFTVENANGAVASFTTDQDGRFRVSLAPGHYTISRKGEKHKIGRYGPFAADVVAGQLTKVEWNCDSGMR